MKTLKFLLLLFIVALQGCASCPPKDYRAYAEHMPASIVVLPPINESAEVKASDAFLSTVTRFIAEDGYYVFPVALVDQHMKENGVTVPGEMHAINPRKFREIYGADAVLYIHVKEWTTTYVVIDSTTKVTLSYRLVDTDTGTEFWTQQATYAHSSSAGQTDLIAMAVLATARAIASAVVDLETEVARYTNGLAFNDPSTGLIKGQRHPQYEQAKLDLENRIRAIEEWEQKEAEKEAEKQDKV